MTPEERAKEIVKWLADLLKPWTAFYGHEEYFEQQIREAITAARNEALQEAALIVRAHGVSGGITLKARKQLSDDILTLSKVEVVG